MNEPFLLNTAESVNAQSSTTTIENVIPRPVSTEPTAGSFVLTEATSVYVQPATDELMAIGRYLTDKVNPATGYDMQIRPMEGTPANGNIYLTTVGGNLSLGDEGYELTITPDLVTLAADQPAGLFRGIQTFRQLLPPAIESLTVQNGRWEIPAGTIRDRPRFGWRGAMLDVAWHFFGVEDVKRFIDLIAYYKMNRLHLHLTDDQGWRIMIDSWPKLATYGGSTAVGGGVGGFYSQAEYAEIVAYAQSRYIMVIPEIDLPGHSNAALASYTELNCDGVAPPLYSGVEVGFSSLCIAKEITLTFVADVVREIAALTPSPYLHIGGDEALATDKADYVLFIEQVQALVHSYGKEMIGWEEIAQAKLLPTSIAQYWKSDVVQTAVQQSAKVILSPGSRAYLDMKYDESTLLGLNWAGYVEVDAAYNWDPTTQISGVTEADILGVEAPLWSETVETMSDIEWMAFPRLPGIAEIGWSPIEGREWDEYRLRLAAMGVDFYSSPLVPWR